MLRSTELLPESIMISTGSQLKYIYIPTIEPCPSKPCGRLCWNICRKGEIERAAELRVCVTTSNIRHHNIESFAPSIKVEA